MVEENSEQQAAGEQTPASSNSFATSGSSTIVTSGSVSGGRLTSGSL